VNRTIRYIIIGFILIQAIISPAQQGSNPFEIIRTKDLINSSNEDTISNQTPTKGSNAFEVFRKDDTKVPFNNPSNAEQISTEDAADTKDSNTDLIRENPFEVSHVPYRRSELKKQAKRPLAVTTPNKRSVVNSGSTSNTFIFWLILFSLLLLAMVVNVQRSAIPKIAKSITNENILKLTKREENGGLSGHYITLYVIFFINLATFLYLLINKNISFYGFSNWLYIVGLIAGVYLLRHICMSLLGNIFNISKDSTLYSFTIMTFNIFLGLALIPVNLVVAFSPTEIGKVALYIGIGLIIILLLIRYIRGLLIGVRFLGDHIFQFFLYLCVFEIAPILILMRILGDQ